MKILVLFDIDGTILQMKKGISKEIFSRFLINLFGKNIENAHIPTFHGMTDLQIIKEIALNIGYPFEQIEENLTEIWSDLSKDYVKYCKKENMKLMPGIVELLDLLDKDDDIKLGLLTGNIKNNAYAKLDVYGLSHYFPVGAFGDDCYDRDKLPEIAFRRANEYYKGAKFNSDNSMIVGDSPLDIKCGKSNNMSVLAVATGWSSREELAEHSPEFLFDDFKDANNVYKTIKNYFGLK